jgi:hypothetical protein
MTQPRRRVSEKTLELNIVAEILSAIRLWSGFQSAFWMGPTQQQEARHGADELLLGTPPGHHLALQFKSPRPNPPDTDPFVFPINPVQHGNLARLAGSRAAAVYYVLPNINTLSSVRAAVPSLLSRTLMVPVSDVVLQPPARSHTATCQLGPPHQAIFRSDPRSSTAFLARDFFAAGSDESPRLEQSGLLTSEELFDWLTGTPVNAQSRGANLRGFGTIFVPTADQSGSSAVRPRPKLV